MLQYIWWVANIKKYKIEKYSIFYVIVLLGDIMIDFNKRTKLAIELVILAGKEIKRILRLISYNFYSLSWWKYKPLSNLKGNQNNG